jgi:hypothetical protein
MGFVHIGVRRTSEGSVFAEAFTPDGHSESWAQAVLVSCKF